MFLDPSGRRRVWVSLVGAALAALTAAWLTGLILGATGFASLPAVHVPRLFRAERPHAARVFVAARPRPHAVRLDTVRH